MSDLKARWYGQALVIGDDRQVPADQIERLPAERDRCRR